MIKKTLILCFFAAMLFSATAGIHTTEKAPAFALKNLAINTPAEFAPAAQILSGLLEKIGKVPVAVTTQKGNIVFKKSNKERKIHI